MCLLPARQRAKARRPLIILAALPGHSASRAQLAGLSPARPILPLKSQAFSTAVGHRCLVAVRSFLAEGAQELRSLAGPEQTRMAGHLFREAAEEPRLCRVRDLPVELGSGKLGAGVDFFPLAEQVLKPL